MGDTATVASLQEQFAPLTEAEAGVVLRRQADEQRCLLDEESTDEPTPIEDLVAQVKSERVGPASFWEQPDAEPEPAAEPAATTEDVEALIALHVDQAVAEHATTIEGLQAQLDAVTAERDHAHEALVTAEAERDELRTHIEAATGPTTKEEGQ